MKNRKMIGAVAMSAALATGGIVGATLGTPGSSGAQDSPTTTTAPADGTARPDGEGRGGRPGFGGGVELEAAAKAIGTTVEELRTQLRDGTTIAEVAEAAGVEKQTVIDAMVAAAEARLEEQKATLPDRMAEIVDGTLPAGGPGGGHGGGPGGPGGRGGFGLDVAAEALGLTPEELRTQLRDGTSIADVAAAEDVDLQDVIDALVADAKTRIAASVEDGTITQAQADERLADLEARITERVNDTHEGRGPGGHGPDGEAPAPPEDGTTTTTQGG